MNPIQEFDFSVDLLRALLWQYDGSAGIQSVLGSKSAWYEENQSAFWSDWIRDVFTIATANEFGCSVWGVILGIPLSIGQPSTGDRPVFGFGTFNLNFENGNFGRDSAGIASLTLEQKRLVLRLRYWQLTSDGTAPYANLALKDVFGMGYVLDGEDMTITYVFPTALSSQVLEVLQVFDLLPRPAGVEVKILISPADVFGFAPYYLNFNNGAFGE